MAFPHPKVLQSGIPFFPSSVAQIPNKADRTQTPSAVSRQSILVRALGTSPPTELDGSLNLVSRHITVTFARLELLEGRQAFVPTAGDAFGNHKIHIRNL
jgi:hypothetical protein